MLCFETSAFVSVCVGFTWPNSSSPQPSSGSDRCLLTEYMALTIWVVVETSSASSSRLWVSLLTVSTLIFGLPRVMPRRPGRKELYWWDNLLLYCWNNCFPLHFLLILMLTWLSQQSMIVTVPVLLLYIFKGCTSSPAPRTEFPPVFLKTVLQTVGPDILFIIKDT